MSEGTSGMHEVIDTVRTAQMSNKVLSPCSQKAVNETLFQMFTKSWTRWLPCSLFQRHWDIYIHIYMTELTGIFLLMRRQKNMNLYY
jgi:hypothetical protein